MFFDRYEIHIQAFLYFINGKLSFSDPHLHQNIFKVCTQNSTIKKRTTQTNNMVPRTHCFLEHFRFFESHIDKDNISQDVPILFLCFLKHFGNR